MDNINTTDLVKCTIADEVSYGFVISVEPTETGNRYRLGPSMYSDITICCTDKENLELVHTGEDIRVTKTAIDKTLEQGGSPNITVEDFLVDHHTGKLSYCVTAD